MQLISICFLSTGRNVPMRFRKLHRIANEGRHNFKLAHVCFVPILNALSFLRVRVLLLYTITCYLFLYYFSGRGGYVFGFSLLFENQVANKYSRLIN